MNVQFDEDKMGLLLMQMKEANAQTEECYLGLRQLYNQLSEDAAMQMVPETHLALGHLERAASRLYMLRDRMEYLTEVLRGYPEAYKEREKRLEKQAQELSTAMHTWSVGVSAMSLGGYDTVLGSDVQTGSAQSASAVNQTASTVGITNLGMLKSAVEDGYGKTE